jgi:hypothetical protein
MVDYIFQQPNLTTGVDDAIVDVATAVPTFPIMILFFTFFTVLFGGMASQNRRTGTADLPMWSLLASLSTLLMSLLMTIKEGIISGWVLGIVIALNILIGFWYFMSKGKGEI